MTKYLLLSLILTAWQVKAQMKEIKGQLKDKAGEPLPGVSVLVKGTSRGTVTDLNGNYTIEAPIGSVLVFSRISMKSLEGVVTKDGLKSADELIVGRISGKRPSARSLYRDTFRNERGVYTFSDQSAHHKFASHINPRTILRIQKVSNLYRIKLNKAGRVTPLKFRFEFSTAAGFEKANRLPSLQRAFAQGRSTANRLSWMGPADREIFSWGPAMKDLEYDGVANLFDRNGNLVGTGKGNGMDALSYNPLKFFRSGSSVVNEMLLTIPGPLHGRFHLDVESRNRRGIIPNNGTSSFLISGRFSDLELPGDLRVKLATVYNTIRKDLSYQGANLVRIVGSVYQTPVSFDNANGLTQKEALNGSMAYLLPDGSRRSFAAGMVDNPYRLVQELPDYSLLEKIYATTSVNRYINLKSPQSLKVTLAGSVNSQLIKSGSSIPIDFQNLSSPVIGNNSGGGLLERKEADKSSSFSALLDYSAWLRNFSFHVKGIYRLDHASTILQRDETFYTKAGDEDSAVDNQWNPWRRMQQWQLNTKIDYKRTFTLKLANNSYFSNTLPSGFSAGFLPFASLDTDLDRLLKIRFFSHLDLYGSVGSSIEEAPLIYRDWSYLSTNLAISDYGSFYPSMELVGGSYLLPATIRKQSIGMKSGWWDDFEFNAHYDHSRTLKMILPVYEPSGFRLANVADVIENEWVLTLSDRHKIHIYNAERILLTTRLGWKKYRNKVDNLHTSHDFIPIAGFKETHSVLAKGQPVGAIVGSTYLRDQHGRLVIDSDGFPIKDEKQKVIGNPNPDWTLDLFQSFGWKGLKLGMHWEYNHGGDRWNGTQAFLDYYGRSARTGKERSISGFVFSGVDEKGNMNTIPVNFSDIQKPVSENRWVRYGVYGVTEDYIRRNSWVRLKELALAYSVGKQRTKLRVSLVAKNLLLISRYDGVDPSSGLFGSARSFGLDFLNLPLTRQYFAKVTIKI